MLEINPTKEKTMASDERHEDVPEKIDVVPEGEAVQGEDAPTGFPDRWAGGPDDSSAKAEGFGDKWSGNPDESNEKVQEFGERWAGGPDDSPERAENFGATWSGENKAEETTAEETTEETK
jgi:hypothetical protein